MIRMTLKDLEEQYPGIKEWSRDEFTGNECGSDEYRETQPSKGLGMLSELFDDGGTMTPEQHAQALTLMAAWMTRMANPRPEDYSYAGADELVPLLEMYHDDLWARNRHPYDYDTGPDYFDADRLNDFKEDQARKA